MKETTASSQGMQALQKGTASATESRSRTHVEKVVARMLVKQRLSGKEHHPRRADNETEDSE